DRLELLGSKRDGEAGGGGAGACGQNRLLRADGTTLELPGSVQLELQSGDRLCIATPGGGGYGALP
ncbi:MAG: hydantoinase B/oxoprolinase family protein, partial [Vulcanococcus sp.]